MDESVHFIPVGFDFERLFFPISKNQMDADRVIIVTHDGHPDEVEGEDQQAVRLAGSLADRLHKSFEMIDVEVEEIELTRQELYDYEDVYRLAHKRILRELNEENEVFVNISSMPRTVAFAFATAADSLITERKDEFEDIRKNLHTYYVRPDKYVALEMLEELEKEIDFLDDLDEHSGIAERKEEIQNLVSKVHQGGVTEGTKHPPESDIMYVEFPASPGSEVEGFEENILRFLEGKDSFSSTSALAKELAEEINEEYDGSFRSRVQYNVSNLEDKGYVTRSKSGNRMETSLSTMGRMWVITH